METIGTDESSDYNRFKARVVAELKALTKTLKDKKHQAGCVRQERHP